MTVSKLANDPFKRSDTGNNLGIKLGKINDVTRTAEISSSRSADRFFFGLENRTGTVKKKGRTDTEILLMDKGAKGGAGQADGVQHDKIDRWRAIVEGKHKKGSMRLERSRLHHCDSNGVKYNKIQEKFNERRKEVEMLVGFVNKVK
jgi:hypothetical protein